MDETTDHKLACSHNSIRVWIYEKGVLYIHASNIVQLFNEMYVTQSVVEQLQLQSFVRILSLSLN